MRLDFREKVTYVIYTEPYSIIGITRDEFLDIARSIRGVAGAHPYLINDEIEVSLFSYCNVHDFMKEFKFRLDALADKIIRESAV